MFYTDRHSKLLTNILLYSHFLLSDDTDHRLNTAQIFRKSPKNLICNEIVPLRFETNTEDIYTKPLIREHHESNFYYIHTHSLAKTAGEHSFSILFTSLLNPNGTFLKSICLSNNYIHIAHVFTSFCASQF